MFARLAPGVTHEQAAAEATAVLQARRSRRAIRRLGPPATTMAVESFPAAQIGEERMLVFTFLNVLAALILLLALVNVTTLLTARANERIRETAVRLALGASTGRLVMQGMWEGVILCLAARRRRHGRGGVGARRDHAAGRARTWRATWPSGGCGGWIASRSLSAGAFVTVAIAVLGSVVSLRAIRTNVREVMQDGSARSGSRREGRLARVLVATQVTTVTVLMFVGVLSGVMAQRVVNARSRATIRRTCCRST